MLRKVMMVLAVALIAALVALPVGAQFCSPFGIGTWGLGGISPFGIGGFGAVSPFGTSFSTGYSTVSTFTSGFTAVNGVVVPFGFSPWGFGLGFGPFGFC